MTLTPERLRQIHYDYLLSRQPISLPLEEPFPDRGGDPFLYGSELSFCPIRTSYRRMGVEKTHPDLDTDYGTLQRWAQGHAIADIWKKAMIWGFGDRCEIEKEVRCLNVPGHIDICLDIEGIKVPIEVKNTVHTEKQRIHEIQLQFYMMALGEEVGLLIYQKGEVNQIWQVARNDEPVKELIRNHDEIYLSMLEGTLYEPGLETNPQYWCCREEKELRIPREAKRASKNFAAGEQRHGNVTVTCPFFAHCHPGKNSYYYKTEYGPRGLELL